MEQFALTFLSEMAPMFFGALVILLYKLGTKGSFRKGWSCCGHRRLLPLVAYSTVAKREGGTEPTFTGVMGFYLAWFFLGLPSSLSSVIVCLFLWYPSEMSAAGVDRLEVYYVVGMLVVRHLVIATKYGYFRRSDLDLMDEGPDAWSPAKSARKMLLAGWTGTPRL